MIAGTGDRRDEDIVEIGKIAAEMFDHVILRQENHLRGRKKEELLGLMEEGILSAEKKGFLMRLQLQKWTCLNMPSKWPNRAHLLWL